MDISGVRHIEWEYLSVKAEVANLSPSPNIIPHPDRATIARNDDYGFDFTMEGDGAPFMSPSPHANVRSGELLSGEDITATPSSIPKSAKITLHSVHAGSRSICGDGKFTIQGILSGITCERNNPESVRRVIEYCVSGPDLDFSTQSTAREFSTTSTVTRTVSESPTPDFWAYKFPLQHRSMSRDSFYVANSSFEVLAARAPENLAPKWLKPISIQFGPQPLATDADYRARVLESLSFALGRRLISIGHTFLDKDHYPIKQKSVRPYSDNLKHECAARSIAPCHKEWDHGSFSEARISQIAELYLKARSNLSLNDVLWDVWIARSFPWGMNLVAYSGALEQLAKAWLSTDENRGAYVPHEEYKQNIGVAILELIKTLPNSDSWKPIANKLKNANSIGSADRVKKFLDGIHLPIGEVEKNVLIARNRFAHGGASASFGKEIFLSVTTKAYETLISRAILKTIGYSGTYVDYSTYEFPERDLDQPLGGPEGDGKLPLPS